MRRAHGGRSSVGRVLGCDPSCRGFEPRRPPSCERPLISSNESRGRLSYIAVFRTSQYTPAMSANLNDLTSVCVHCGFCLPACPTYALTGDENDSPRGRIHLIRQVLTSQAQLDPAVAEHVDSCLGCLSCVTACPSGVRYDRIIEEFRPRVEQAYAEPRGDRMFRRLVFAPFPHPLRLRIAALGAVPYPRTGGPALPRPRAFQDAEVEVHGVPVRELDAIVVNVAGCGSTLKQYGELLADDPEYAERAAEFAARVRDVSEVLAGLEPRAERHPVRARVAYHDACPLAHGQGVR